MISNVYLIKCKKKCEAHTNLIDSFFIIDYMKVITYHYIKSFDKKLIFNLLDKKKFIKQLIFFEKIWFNKKKSEIFQNNNKVLLTFDDGLKDHIFAAKTLKKLNRIGIFFLIHL